MGKCTSTTCWACLANNTDLQSSPCMLVRCLHHNFGRHLGIDPESALRATNAKFVRRFGAIERALSEQNRSVAEASLDEMEALWQAAKANEIS